MYYLNFFIFKSMDYPLFIPFINKLLRRLKKENLQFKASLRHTASSGVPGELASKKEKIWLKCRIYDFKACALKPSNVSNLSVICFHLFPMYLMVLSTKQIFPKQLFEQKIEQQKPQETAFLLIRFILAIIGDGCLSLPGQST